MRQVPLKMVKAGEELAVNVNSGGRTLLRKGHILKDRDIRILNSMGIRTVSVEDEFSDGAVSRGTISEETREEAVGKLKNVMDDHENLNTRRYEGISEVANTIVSDIMSVSDLRIQMHDLRTHDDYTYRHSVNVTAVATSIARDMNFEPEDLRILASGALLHDIGKMTIPIGILNKTGPLNQDEVGVIKRHPISGFDLLASKTQSPHQVWALARQHHEHLDGTGYPDARKGEDIHLWSRIVTVADIWDALRSDRPYKRGWSAKKTIDFMSNKNMVNKIDQKILDIFR